MDTGPVNCSPTETLITATADGWVDGCSNASRIQGPWYTYEDPGGSSADVDATGGPQGTICVKGTALQVQTDSATGELDWDSYWGAGLGLDICQNGDDETPAGTKYTIADCPRDLSGITGFSFTIQGDQFPSSGVRVTFGEEGRDSNTYVTVNGTGSQTVRFSQATVEWDTSGSEPAININKVTSLQFQIPSVDSSTVSFDFCISELETI